MARMSEVQCDSRKVSFIHLNRILWKPVITPWMETLIRIQDQALFWARALFWADGWIISGVSAHVLHQNHMHMHAYHTRCVRSCEYTQPPWAFTRTWVTTRIKRVDKQYLGAYTLGGRYYRAFAVVWVMSVDWVSNSYNNGDNKTSRKFTCIWTEAILNSSSVH